MNDNNIRNTNADNSANTEPNYQAKAPVTNGEVYFANYQKNRNITAQKIYASSYEESEKTPSKPKNDGSTQRFNGVSSAPKTANKTKYSAAMPRENAAADSKKKQPSATQRADSKPISRYKDTLNPKNANKRINSKKVNDENMASNFKKEDEVNSKNDKKIIRRAKRAQRRSQPNYIKKLLTSVISVVLITALLSSIGIGCINDVLAINGTDEEIVVTIPENAGTSDVLKILKSAKLIHNKSFCKLFSEFRGYSKSEYISGVYFLRTNMGLEGMLDELKGNVSFTSRETVSLSFPEGWTVQQIMEKLVKNEAIESDKKFLNALNFDYSYSFITDNDDVVTNLEGFMFPDTYEFFVGESASSVIRKFLDNFKNKWTTEYQQRANALGLSVNEVITIASIIQKEAGNDEQMAGISAVIHNRLKRSVDYPYLQCDSTANYVTKYITEIVGKGKENAYKKNYDTSEKTGLPSGPICNPGEEAIAAALYPDETNNALYFNHDDNGKIYYAGNEVDFAKNLEEAKKINEELSAQYY